MYQWTVTGKWATSGQPNIDIEVGSTTDQADAEQCDRLQSRLDSVLVAMAYPGSDNDGACPFTTCELLQEATVQLRTVMQQMGGITWVRCAINGQALMVFMEV